ncbi:MAG TPA: ABC transporter ATP-binding protein [Rhodopila sp.]|uniref:ABC transporter ATP-binding protein n=1 Tax=Rhodopila sp. TaxID=2480087 RepID=UPI002D09F7BE|nr:ABC transporter ATP-binding protein [Rhodopila sp.]HVY16330.1 ABC transporter ATP-binding protein [Rhodopila sp.]
MSPTAMLNVAHLNVRYGVTEVLRDVSFAVPEGKIIALLGGNGSGKTTILNTLTGLIRPRAGSITVAGVETAGWPADRLVRHGVAQVPQGREVFAAMTVEENLDLGAVTRHDRAAIAADRDEIYALFPALTPNRRRRAGSLSGGEQQQVAIGRALMSRPKLLLMDEPSAGLSPLVVGLMVDTIRALHARGMTILLVEQNVGVAAAVAETAHVLQNGAIVHTGSAPALINSHEVLASYLGR